MRRHKRSPGLGRRLIGYSITLSGVAVLAFAVVGFAAPGWAVPADPSLLDTPAITPDTAVPGNANDGLSSTDGIASDSISTMDGANPDGTAIPEETLPADSSSVGTDLTYSDSTDSPEISSTTTTSIQTIATSNSTVKAVLNGHAYTVTDTASWDVGTVLVGGIVTLTLTTPTTLSGNFSTEADSPGGSPLYTVTTSYFNRITSATELDVFVDSSLGRVVAIEPQGASTTCVVAPGHFCPSSIIGGTS